MKDVVLAFGANLGDAETTFYNAETLLRKGGFRIEKTAPVYRSKAVDCEDGAPDFTNTVIVGSWNGTAEELLKLCQKIEVVLGRPSNHAKGRSRTMDVDVILFGTEKISLPHLVIPHPRAAERDFVTVPLSAVAPELLGLLR